MWSKRKQAERGRSAQGSDWTQGSQLGVKLTSTLLLAAALCGPVGIALGMTALQSKPAVAQAVVDESLSIEQQGAGEYGAAFVAAWLGATRDTPGSLSAYVSESGIRQLSAEATAYRDLVVVSVEPKQGSDLVSVVVAANVEELDTSNDEGLMIWPRRYFAVSVRVADAGVSVVGLPALIAAPTRIAEPIRLAYVQSVLPTSSARATVEAFLGAYLAGSGDITRYVTPGVTINAIAPSPYVNFTVIDVQSDVTPSDSPRTGDVLHVLAVAEVQSATGQQLTTTYALTLTARDGRWETTSVDLAPLESSAPRDASTSTPSR